MTLISTKSIFTAFERPSRGNRQFDTFQTENGMITLPPFLASKNLFPLINTELLAMITEPIIYIDGTQEQKGYRAEILPMMCSLYLEAKNVNCYICYDVESAINALKKHGLIWD